MAFFVLIETSFAFVARFANLSNMHLRKKIALDFWAFESIFINPILFKKKLKNQSRIYLMIKSGGLKCCLSRSVQSN